MTFHYAITRPIRSDLAHTRDATQLWYRSRKRFIGNVVGPHFARVCRHWTRHDAPDGMFGDFPTKVDSGTVHDPANRTSHEVDVVVFGHDDGGNRKHLLALGEAKWGERMGLCHLERLRHIRGLLTTQGRPGAESARLACYSGVGFTEELREQAAGNPEIALIGLNDLYR